MIHGSDRRRTSQVTKSRRDADDTGTKTTAEDRIIRALKNRRQISITVTGRRSGRAVRLPVWFVLEKGAVWLLPVYGSETQWYRNLRVNPTIAIQAGTESWRFRARLVRETRAVRAVIRWFREKYTPEQIAHWYSGLDVAVKVPLMQTEG